MVPNLQFFFILSILKNRYYLIYILSLTYNKVLDLLGVTFQSTVDTVDSNGVLIPYGLPAVYELLRWGCFFIYLGDPL